MPADVAQIGLPHRVVQRGVARATAGDDQRDREQREASWAGIEDHGTCRGKQGGPAIVSMAIREALPGIPHMEVGARALAEQPAIRCVA